MDLLWFALLFGFLAGVGMSVGLIVIDSIREWFVYKAYKGGGR